MYRTYRVRRLHIWIAVCLLTAGVLFLAVPFFTGAEEAAATGGEPQWENTQHTIYLTFDDGPSPVTGQVLDVLQQYGVPATFFVLGETTDEATALYHRITDEGHTIGIHSYTHSLSIYQNLDNFIDDFERLEDLIADTTGSLSFIYRMPGGSNSANCPAWLKEEIMYYTRARGYVLYDWDIDPVDSREYTLSAQELSHNVTSAAAEKPSGDLIILMHDDALRTTLPDALPDIIEYFQGKGYRFDALRRDTVLEGASPWVKTE